MACLAAGLSLWCKQTLMHRNWQPKSAYNKAFAQRYGTAAAQLRAL
jgi:hypothetical protein